MADEHHMSIDKLAALRRDDAMSRTKIIGAQLKMLQHNQNHARRSTITKRKQASNL
jgi:hypothetical protein